MNTHINYSIIIPHKNTSELLQRCITTIPYRKDIQVIIVDDNSDSQKINFETFPGLNDLRTDIIFTKEGKGAGYARNMGLRKAIGKWILFADADDVFTDGFLEHLDKYKDSPYDLIYFGISRVGKKTEKRDHLYKEYDKLIKNAVEKRKHDAYKYTAYFPWGKMVRLSLIKENKILFDETLVANDRMFSIKTAYHATAPHFDSYKIYTYMAEDSCLTQIKTMEAKYTRFCVYVHANRFLEDISKKKYKTNLVRPLKNLINIQDLKYFHEGIKIMKENGFNLFVELFHLCLSLPQKIGIKAMNAFTKVKKNNCSEKMRS